MTDAVEAMNQVEESTMYPCSETDWQRNVTIERQRWDDAQPRSGTTDRGTTIGVVSCNDKRRKARKRRVRWGQGRCQEEDWDTSGDRAVAVKLSRQRKLQQQNSPYEYDERKECMGVRSRSARRGSI